MVLWRNEKADLNFQIGFNIFSTLKLILFLI